MLTTQIMESYDRWNAKALNYFFSSTESESVYELDVSDKSLASVAAESLVYAVRQMFSEADLKALERKWRFQSQIGSTPGYFAYLLATCRIEWERESGQFASEFRSKLNVNPNPWIEMLPDLWRGLEKFLKGNEDQFRRLLLPSHYANFNRIGHSVGLVFPRRTDRNRLAEMFANLGEREPRISEVCKGLEGVRNSLTAECREEADWFRDRVCSLQADTRVVRFWQILRQTLESSSLYEKADAFEPVVTLASWNDEDGIIEPWLLLRDDANVPGGFDILNDAIGLDHWSRVLSSSGNEHCSGMSVFSDEDDDVRAMLGDQVVSLLQDGVLPLMRAGGETDVDWLIPAVNSGDEIVGYLFHKRSDLAKHLESGVSRCQEVRGSDWLSYMGEVEGLGGQYSQRLRKRTPKLRVRGVKIRRNEYLNLPGFHPEFHCDVSDRIEWFKSDSSDMTPRQSAKVPEALGETTIRALSDNGDVICETKVRLVRQLPVVHTSSWCQFSAPYWLPAPTTELGARSKDSPVPQFLDSDGEQAVDPKDTTLWQCDEIWLGPRVGDVSSRRQPGFDWRLVESSDQKERLLSFEGAEASGSQPDLSAVSTNKRACRLWRRAFDPRRTRCQNPEWEDAFSSFGVLRNPQRHKQIYGKEIGQFHGDSPPVRKPIELDFGKVSVNKGVNVLETVLRARTSGKRSPLTWPRLWSDSLAAFGFDEESLDDRSALLSVLRAWQEIGVFDTATTAWGGLSCAIRRPHFVTRKVEDCIVGTLVGLTSERLRKSLCSAAEDDGWQCDYKYSSSGSVPPVLEIRKSLATGSQEIAALSSRFGLSPSQNLAWADLSELPKCILPLGSTARFFTQPRHMLPVSQPLWTKAFSSITISKFNSRGLPPAWVVGSVADRWAICTSADWGWRLAYLAENGTLPFQYANGKFWRKCERTEISTEGIYLPLEAARLLTIIGTRLPGPEGGSYCYYAPSEMSGSLLADRLSIQKQ
ncbi:MAG: hypothetical protein AAGG48_26015 [Planctomycetota bacterium]